MKTERLYYNDPYLLEFDATIVEMKPVGDRLGIVLDKTAFYPTSGGQPFDLGTIADLVPLAAENRILTALGLRRLQSRVAKSSGAPTTFTSNSGVI